MTATGPSVHVRIDNRLLHGQVVQFWIPYLEVDRLVIGDDETASNQAMTAVYRMAVPGRVDLAIVSVDQLPQEIARKPAATTLVLLSDVFDAARALMCGMRISKIVLGNVHATHGRERVTDSVYLSAEEADALLRLCEKGIGVEIQTFPGERLKLEIGNDGEPRWLKR